MVTTDSQYLVLIWRKIRNLCNFWPNSNEFFLRPTNGYTFRTAKEPYFYLFLTAIDLMKITSI